MVICAKLLNIAQALRRTLHSYAKATAAHAVSLRDPPSLLWELSSWYRFLIDHFVFFVLWLKFFETLPRPCVWQKCQA